MNGAASGDLTLRGLGKVYGGSRVVRDVDVTVREGEFFSLLGPSGSGKTTTLMMIAGFVNCDGGSIRLGERDITSQAPRQRGFGMVFQNYALFPHMSVARNVEFPLRVRGVSASQRKERVDWALDVVRLGAFADRSPRQLSGGQQQRVALARAIVYEPPVVLMDEPLGALDKNLRFQMQSEIKDIQKRLGMTVVYVTHDQEEAMNMSDRLAIMRDGEIAQIGPPAEVYQAPADSFVARFLGEANLVPVEIAGAGRARRGSLAFTASAGNTAPAFGRALLFVRPERVRIARQADPAMDNTAPAEVARISYLGNLVRYGVVLDGEEITVDVQNMAGTPEFGVGDRVHLGWMASDCHLLAPDAASGTTASGKAA